MQYGKFYVNLSDINFIATEALTPEQRRVMGPDTETSMQVAIVTDKMIEKAKLKQVSDPIMYASGNTPTSRGLFSSDIFGDTAEKTTRTYAYIDLGGTFFHPFVYEILCKLNGKVKQIVSGGNGQWSWVIREGELVKVDKDSPEFNELNDGLTWLVSHFDEIDFRKNNSVSRNDRVDLIKNLSKDEIFITKYLVTPIHYRSVVVSASGKRDIPEINRLYAKVIRYSNTLREEFFDFYNIASTAAIQNTLYDIRKFGQSMVQGKHGHFHKQILGKSIDRGSRDVISTPVLNNYQRPAENPIDIFHTGVPLAKCIVLGYNFILRYCLNFFSTNFKNVHTYPIYELDKAKNEYKLVSEVEIKDQLRIVNSEYIDKKIKRFLHSPGTRFELIEIEAVNGNKLPIHFSGMFQPMRDRINQYPKSIVDRPMTWTDLFYRAAVDTLSDKYMYVTRYPITSHNSIFATMCVPMSTMETIPVVVDGILYKNYPVVIPNLPNDKVGTLFNDTLTFSNLMLPAINGDFNLKSHRSPYESNLI